MLRSHSIRTIQELSGKQEDRMEPQSLLEVIELDSVLLKHPTCLQQNHAGNRKNNGGFFKAAMSQSCQRATN